MHDPESPHRDLYDEEIILSFSDWYHGLMRGLLADFISIKNPSGAEPVPDSALMNDTQNLGIPIQPGKTYLFRMVNMGAFAAQHVWFEGHTMKVVEVDGVYTEPADADMLYITAAQRYSVLVTMKNSTDANFPIVGSMDEVSFCGASWPSRRRIDKRPGVALALTIMVFRTFLIQSRRGSTPT